MRNLKRVLALALALVMTLGLLIIGSSAASYTDAAQINDDYADAIEVLTGMGVFQGMEGNAFSPTTILTRAQAATLVYRVLTGDVTDAKVDLYDYKSFNDVPAGKWYTGYVTYAANGGYIKGWNGNFSPDDQVTGVQVLAIMLRAVGYGQNGEFEGAAWKDNTLTTANDLGLLDGIDVKSLDAPAQRQLVAQLLFNAITEANIVYYTPALGYYTGDVTNGLAKTTLGKKVFDLTNNGRQTVDDWGRPGVIWTYNTGDEKTTLMEDALATYTTKVSACQITIDANRGKDMKNLGVWINANEQSYYYSVAAADEVTKLGAQGRLTEVYSDRIVMIDTMLAQVSAVTAATYDTAGHKVSNATMTLKVYDTDTASTYSTVTLSSNSNYTYTAGAMILVNVKTAQTATGSAVVLNDMFGGHGLAVNSTLNATTGAVIKNTVHKLVGVAESFEGAQTLIYYSVDQHTVNGTTYQDANCFHLDQAGVESTTHIWYKDQYGNLIGAADKATIYSYGTITAIAWTGTGLLSNGYATANLVLMDGTTLNGVTIKAIGDATNSYGVGGTEPTPLTCSDAYVSASINAVSVEAGYVSTTLQNNIGTAANAYAGVFYGKYLYQIEQNADGSYNLYAVANAGRIPATVTTAGATVGTRLGTDVTVTSKVSYIAKGTGASIDAPNGIVTDSATRYLIQNASTGAFTAVTGFNNIDSYTNATVDYVDVNNDGRADYVFIYGTPVSAATSGLFYVGYDANGNALVTVDPATGVYTVYGIFNGVAGSIQVKNPVTGSTLDFWNYTAANTGTASQTYNTAVDFVTRLINHSATWHSVYDVKIVNGYVVGASGIDSTAEALGDWTAVGTLTFKGPYSNLNGIRHNASTTNPGVYANDVLSIGGCNYNTTTATKFIIDGVVYAESQITEGVAYTNHTIHVVYDSSAKQIASEVYIWTTSTGSSGTVIPGTGHTLTFTVGSGRQVTTTAGVVIASTATTDAAGTYTFLVLSGAAAPTVTASSGTLSVTIPTGVTGVYVYTITGVTAATTITVS